MGAEVQSKMYLPGYYSVRDLNSSAGNGDWPVHHENKTFEQYYGMFSARPATDGCMGYEKEQLRQTILKHETIFRHQLHELHRLYKIQRDMMNEARSREPHKHVKPMTPQSTLFSFSSKDDKRWHGSTLPFGGFNCDMPSGSGADYIHSHFSSMDVKVMQSGYCSTQGQEKFKDHDSLKSKYNKLQRRLFDLELPVEEYMNDEDEGQRTSGGSNVASYPPNSNCRVTCENNGNLATCSGVYSCNGDASSSNIYLRRSQVLTDLNEPIPVEEASGTDSVDILGNITCSKENMKWQDQSVNSCSGFQCLSKEILQSPYKEKYEVISMNNPQLENESGQKGWLANVFNSGPIISSSSPPSGGLLSESSHVGCKKVYEVNHGKTENQTKKTIFGVEISDGNHDASVLASNTPILHQLVPQSNLENSESSSISSWKKHPASLGQNLISVERNPCLNAFPNLNKSSVTLMHDSGVAKDRSLYNESVKQIPTLGAEPSYQNGLLRTCHSETKESRACLSSVRCSYLNGVSDSSSASGHVSQHSPTNNIGSSGWLMNGRSAEGVNLNMVPPNVHQNEAIPGTNLSSSGGSNEEENMVLPWLKVLSVANDRFSKEGDISHHMNLDSIHSQKLVSKVETIKGISKSFVRDSSSVTNPCDVEERTGDDESSNRKIHGVPMAEKYVFTEFPSAYSASRPSASKTNVANPTKFVLLDTDLNHDPLPSDSVEEQETGNLVVKNGSVDCDAIFRHHIDLNVSVTEEETQPTYFSPGAKVRIAVEIDLEAPVDVEAEICISSRGEISQSKNQEPFDLSKDESKDFHEGLMRCAAEALIAISSDQVPSVQDNVACHQSDAPLSNSLQWFAEIISSYKGDVENNADHEDSIPHGSDYFEYMTLNLPETKIEDCHYEPQVLEEPKEEIPLSKRPRRGQVRRGRQRKDFQRDILPGIASLSRNDVTEDLQTIEGLVRTSGGTWQSSLLQRNSPKGKGGRGRKRSAASAASSLTAVSPPEGQQPKCGELGLEETRLTGWGKRTRRPPRQRGPINQPHIQL